MKSLLTFAFVFLTLAAVFYFRSGLVLGPANAAGPEQAELQPEGGGEYPFQPRDEISDETRSEIWRELRANMERLAKDGLLQPASPQDVQKPPRS